MGRNQERDARELAARKKRILESAFHVFAERTIEKVGMSEAAEACDAGGGDALRGGLGLS